MPRTVDADLVNTYKDRDSDRSRRNYIFCLGLDYKALLARLSASPLYMLVLFFNFYLGHHRSLTRRRPFLLAMTCQQNFLSMAENTIIRC